MEGPGVNPFRETIVANPWDAARADVPAIHSLVFEECLRGVESVRRNQRSGALLIHGEAGSGKTHLLSRLRARLTPQKPSTTGHDECLYVWVRLQTSPRMIWRTLRRMLVDDWFRPVPGLRSQFERILFHRLAEIRPAEGDLERWYEYMLDEQPDDLRNLMDKIATNLDLDRNTAVAFTHIAFGRHKRDLRAWLAGASLPQAALERMDLAQDEGTDEEREDQSRQVVLMLCRLAGNGLPIVLSFDQVEALQRAPGDRDALFAFGQLMSSMHDGTSNVLLVSCVQSAFATELKDHAREADYDRMTSLGKLSLDPLGRAQAEQLIAARLGTLVESAATGASRSACWPLEPAELDELLAKGAVTPRKLLVHCAERYETRFSRPAAEPAAESARSEAASVSGAGVSAFLDDRWQSCLEQKLAASSPERTEEIVRHGLPMLVELVAPTAKLVRDEHLPDVPLVFQGPAGRTGVSLCTQSNMNSFATQLRRLKTQFTPERLARLVLVRDARVPISAGARRARQYLEELEQQHALIVYPPVEALAALDALRELLSDAKSGDLAYRGEAVAPATVAEWLQGHLAGCLSDFVDDVLGKASGDADPAGSDTRAIELLNDLLAERPVVPIEDAACALQRPVDDVVAVIRRHPEHFGLLGRPPATLFRAVDTTESSA